MKDNMKKYIIFWLSQTVSQLGSSMTSFALILWVYMQNGSAMEVSLMTFFNYIPFIIVSLFSGAFVDRYSKKKIMVIADTVAGLGTIAVLILYIRNSLQVYHIYLVNFVIGITNAFQGPAIAVVTGKIISKEKISRASGFVSFSNNLNMVLAPVLASAIFLVSGLNGILVIDLLSFLFAVLIVVFEIDIVEEKLQISHKQSIIAECKEGYHFLKKNDLVWIIIITLAVINFFSRLTYENILSPMILARSGNDSVTLGIVNAAMGMAGIIGGILVASGKFSKRSIQMIYLSAIGSFLLGDLLMGLGTNVWIWSFAGMAASFPIPFIEAGQNKILYECVPEQLQGRVFAIRNVIQFSTIPIGILLGGFLADYVFEPFMGTNNTIAMLLHQCVGNGAGSGMAVMFLCTGIWGSIFCLIIYVAINKRRRLFDI